MNKCLSFTLPSGAGGMAAGMTRGGIQKKLKELIDQKKIGPNIKSKTVGYSYRVWLENEIDYTVFLLIWDPINSWQKPTVIDEVYTKES